MFHHLSSKQVTPAAKQSSNIMHPTHDSSRRHLVKRRPRPASFPNASHPEPLVVARRLALDAARQAPAILLLVGAFDVGQEVPIPVESDDTGHEEVILGAHAGHGLLEEICGVHVLVNAVSKLEEKRILHVAREFLPTVRRQDILA